MFPPLEKPGLNSWGIWHDIGWPWNRLICGIARLGLAWLDTGIIKWQIRTQVLAGSSTIWQFLRDLICSSSSSIIQSLWLVCTRFTVPERASCCCFVPYSARPSHITSQLSCRLRDSPWLFVHARPVRAQCFRTYSTATRVRGTPGHVYRSTRGGL